MTVFIFTNQKKAKEAFAPLLRSRTYRAQIFPSSDFARGVDEAQRGDFVYLDVTGMEEKHIQRKLQNLTKTSGLLVGILDPRGELSDPAEWLRRGASDYLGKPMLSQPYKPTRIKNIQRYSGFSEVELKEEKGKQGGRIADGSDLPPLDKLVPNGNWDNVVSGETYTFCFLFVEMDLTEDWKKKAGNTHLKKVKETFHRHIAQTVVAGNGRIWMWNEYGGVVLFPFLTSAYKAVYTSARMVLNRLIISCEEFPFRTLISYRQALHIGTTEYHKRGETGAIISDSVNFIFHLGQKFAEPGQMYITKAIHQRIHEGFQKLFVDAGTFEDRLIYRMRSPRF